MPIKSISNLGGKNERQRGLNSEYLIEWRCLRGMSCLKCFVLFFVSSAFQNPHLIPAQEGSWEGRTRRRDDSRRVWGDRDVVPCSVSALINLAAPAPIPN